MSLLEAAILAAVMIALGVIEGRAIRQIMRETTLARGSTVEEVRLVTSTWAFGNAALGLVAIWIAVLALGIAILK